MSSLWDRFQQYFLRHEALGFTLDISRMKFADDFFCRMEPEAQRAFEEMRALEKGAIANKDEDRMVGHYWLRAPQLAPTPELRREIESTNASIHQFAAQVHAGRKFTDVLLIGIGGSALGPQFLSDALGSLNDPIDLHFFDNTDPDGFDRRRHEGDAQRDARGEGRV
jgi:glucose-6-phosphate isomerase